MNIVNMRLYLKEETEFLDFMGTDKILVELSHKECFNTKLTDKLKGVISKIKKKHVVPL